MSMVFPPSNATGLFGYSNEQKSGAEFAALYDLVDVTLPELKNHLQAAILIKTPGPAKWSILNVAQQEMLHLSLAGNILCAIGGEPKLYSLNPPDSENHPKFPSYPDKMFYQETPLNLRGATKANIRTFLDLERPSILKDIDQVAEALDTYGSIGTFYWAVGEALKFSRSSMGDPRLFCGDVEKQLQYGDGSWYNDEMVVVKDLNSALKALDIIIDQGEGSQREPPVRATGSLDPPAPFGVKSQFEIFEDIYKGPPLDYYEVFENPKTESFKTSDPDIYKVKQQWLLTYWLQVLLVGDAAFCYLLQTVETLWKRKEKIKRMHLVNNNLHNIMLYVLRPLSTFLLSKTVKRKAKPTDQKETEMHFNLFFNYYPFAKTGKLAKLKELTRAAVEAFPNDKILPEVKEAVDALEDVGDQ
ncbi:hypothetical protein Clacol_005169 [Clathrus columnatus]|uniref:Iminophenyl-pyruvate dimer synthase domain-containing protein n=1 Tax=Clathrus columnatus TaxID=1419009 RepID=A0AAV5ADE9_9AGAM|nr:hypothetical protein Clacol_005169 [Clathrus columnatus]